MESFCIGCTINLAVYGYVGGGYVLTASSKGVTMIQANTPTHGIVGQGQFDYYIVSNEDPFAVLSFSLTALAGDADLYINTYRGRHETGGKATAVVLPTTTSYLWRGAYYGDDSVRIDYLDANFCVDCDYIVGVYGFRNSTYSLLVTEAVDSVVRLSMNRQQVMSIPAAQEKRYFSIALATSLDDIMFTLTPLDTGYADMYVQQYNVSAYWRLLDKGTDGNLPDPQHPGSYLGESCSFFGQ